MKLATTTGDFHRYTQNQFEAIEYIAKSGFRYIDYNFNTDYNCRNGIFLKDTKGYISKLREKCDELGVEFVQAHSPMGEPLNDPDGEFLKATAECIEACGELGIKNIVVHSGYMKGFSKKKTIEENKVFYDKLLGVAEKYEVNILSENFNKMCIEVMYWIDNASDLMELIECVNHPLFHAVWDTGHGNLQEMSQESELAVLGSHVKALHVHDNDGLSDLHMCPLFGTLDVDSLLNGLRNIGYNGYFTFEACNFFAPNALNSPKFNLDTEVILKAERLMYDIGESIVKNF